MAEPFSIYVPLYAAASCSDTGLATYKKVNVLHPAGSFQLTFCPLQNPVRSIPAGGRIEIYFCLISALPGVANCSTVGLPGCWFFCGNGVV
jgi:hypothetical protein